MKNKTLLILAAGLGSRFGGLKQMTPVGPNGEFIIDYSIYDAINSGFNKIVFVIKKENYDDFLNTIIKRIKKTLTEKKVKIEFVFQNYDNLISKYPILKSRKKPLGTAHAILSAKDAVDDDFIIINADDFYGSEPYKLLSNFIDDNNDNKNLGMVTYDVINTLSNNGSVKRGICNIKNGNIINIEEAKISNDNDILSANLLLNGKPVKINKNDKVSMNMIYLNKNFVDYIEQNFEEFLNNSDLINDEYLIPTVINKSIKNNINIFKSISTISKWAGITYKSDLDSLKDYIKKLINEEKYPNKLWK